jgi:hypothetical protein
MTDSLADSLRAIAPFLKPKLISPDAIAQIAKIAEILPAMPIVWDAGFECRLGVDAPQADFLMSFTPANGGRDILAGRHATANLPQVFFNHPAWKTICNFCDRWADPNSPLHENVTDVWLEFDVDGSPSAVPEPSFFFGPKALVRDSNNEWVTDVALKLLLDSSFSSQTKQNLLKCFNLLPPQARAFHIGVMLSRQVESSVVRPCIRDIPSDRILDYLTNIGWTGSVDELAETMAILSRFVDTIRLNFAVGETVFPKLGIECYFQRKALPEPRLEQFLDYLVAKQLCTVAKRNALLAWPGFSHENSHRDLWPRDLLATSSFLDVRKLSTFVRLIHHIKIVYQPNKPLEAKAYLWFGHNWLDLISPAKTNAIQTVA